MRIDEKYPQMGVQYPEKVLQIGEGNFLRAFSDWMIELANRDGRFEGSVILCQPIEQGLAKLLNEQKCKYTVVMRGMENDNAVEKSERIDCCSRAISPYADYDAFLRIARSKDLKVIISNTTEAGIAYHEGDQLSDHPPVSYPAKLAAFLYERYTHFSGASDAGVLVLPVELIDDNGHVLKKIILRYAEEWKLEAEFMQWVEHDCAIASTLVDRIVTGYPRDEIEQFTEKLAYTDNCLVTCELFDLWVIEADKKWAEVFPIGGGEANVVWTDDAAPYKKRKVRILNGAHTSTVLGAYLAGHDIVLDMMNDEVFSTFMKGLLFEEVIPTIDLPKQDLIDFAAAVDSRFRNPYIKHKLLDISLNSCSKFRARCLPSLLDSAKMTGNKLPARLSASVACLIRFYKGEKTSEGYIGKRENGEPYQIRDDASVIDAFEAAWKADDNESVVQSILSNPELWGEDLTKVEGLKAAVVEALNTIKNKGVSACVKALE